MAINYTWNVNTVDVKEINGNTDTVFNVHWVLTATDDTNNDAEGKPQTATASSTVVLDTSSISNFIPFNFNFGSKYEPHSQAAIATCILFF